MGGGWGGELAVLRASPWLCFPVLSREPTTAVLKVGLALLRTYRRECREYSLSALLWGLLPSNKLIAVRQGWRLSLGRVRLPWAWCIRPREIGWCATSGWYEYLSPLVRLSYCSFPMLFLCSFFLLKGPSPCCVFSFFHATSHESTTSKPMPLFSYRYPWSVVCMIPFFLYDTYHMISTIVYTSYVLFIYIYTSRYSGIISYHQITDDVLVDGLVLTLQGHSRLSILVLVYGGP